MLELLIIPKIVKVLGFVIFIALIGVKLINKLAGELAKDVESLERYPI